MNNTLKTVFLLTSLTLLLVFLGDAAGGEAGMMYAFFMACAMNFGAYWFSDKLVLSMYRAQPVSEAESPELYAIIQGLAERAKIPMPRLYIIPSASPNAFATGRNPSHAAVAVTQGILDILNREELEGVLAHELSHVLHRDILISSIAATLAGAISMLASMVRWTFMFSGGSRRDDREGGSNPLGALLAALILPFAATLIQLAVSRTREFDADQEGALLCVNPLFLASALRKLEAASGQRPMRDAEPSTAHLFIVNPLRGDFLMRLFSTHPATEERIARLEEMARAKGY